VNEQDSGLLDHWDSILFWFTSIRDAGQQLIFMSHGTWAWIAVDPTRRPFQKMYFNVNCNCRAGRVENIWPKEPGPCNKMSGLPTAYGEGIEHVTGSPKAAALFGKPIGVFFHSQSQFCCAAVVIAPTSSLSISAVRRRNKQDVLNPLQAIGATGNIIWIADPIGSP